MTVSIFTPFTPLREIQHGHSSLLAQGELLLKMIGWKKYLTWMQIMTRNYLPNIMRDVMCMLFTLLCLEETANKQ